jgi:hypothetical protein
VIHLVRPSRFTRGLVFSLLALALGAVPPVRLACACAASGGGAKSCCGPKLAANDLADGCCCTSVACCTTETSAARATLCATDGHCQCQAAPIPAERRTIPQNNESKSHEDLAVAAVFHAIPLAAAIPPESTGCSLPLFGPPARGPAVQIAYCIWRN